jgi:hypothetical protein
MKLKPAIKKFLGELPLTAEAYWQLRQNGKPLSKSFSMSRTRKHLPEWRRAVEMSRMNPQSAHRAGEGKQVLLFATLRYWIEHAALMGMALSGLGHEVTLAYLPYANWSKPLNRFDLRRHNAYAQSVLDEAEPFLHPTSLLNVKVDERTLPPGLVDAIRQVSLRDAQYTLQVEDVDLNGALYQLRLERNLQAAGAALAWMRLNFPDVVLTPNGSILEMGAVYQTARYLGIPVVTYEFGEQRGRIWLAQDGEVMLQDTEALWQGRQESKLNEEQRTRLGELYASRQRADLWQNFSRRWQGQPSQGGEQARRSLGLDERPVVLLPANVIGDSLTLGRQVFSQSMTEWLLRTVDYFSERPQVQLVVRVHPGERYTKGPSVRDVLLRAENHPDLPDHIHLVAAEDAVNTYDVVEIADLGLVYTTTVGMEMAMSGAPVIVAGKTHYREKGFTLDPESWEAYFQMLDMTLAQPERYRLKETQVELAWTYAYYFFFEYPRPFPWHLLHFWNELGDWSIERLLSVEGQEIYGDTLKALTGETVRW